MGELAARYPLVVPCGPGVFRPYPGGELYDACLDLGLREPPSLEEWGTYTLSEGYLDPSDLPWVPDPSLLADVPFYMFHIQERHNLAAYSFPQMRRLMAGLSSARARTRLWWLRWEPHAARMLTSVTRRAGHSQLMQSRAPRAR
jgi:hypothetical protein